MISFKELRIKGLFGRSDIKIPIIDNVLILVGYNGTGKSTVLNAFYYFISSQWQKLDELQFDEIMVITTNKKLGLAKSEISLYCRRDQRRRYGIPPRYVQEFLSTLSSPELRHFAAMPLSEAVAFYRTRFPGRIPTSGVQDLRAIARENLLRSEVDTEDTDFTNIRAVQSYLPDELNGRILYLPTYRRIEKDIKTVFPEIENEIQEAIQRRSRSAGLAEVFIELVNFGMEDVKSKITQKLDQLGKQALSEVNNLTTKYLRDVIRNEANTYSEDIAKRIDTNSLEGVFRRVDQSILNADDRNNIDLVIRKIKEGRELEDNERYVAYYIAYLVEVADKVSNYENPMKTFVEVCNSYLFKKILVFDNIEYKFDIRYGGIKHANETGTKEDSMNRNIELEELSSGEKQIVSLFSHLMLETGSINCVIIDEPELSLSIDWQKRFLPDIKETPGCVFLGAVTHSPFIFDNNLEKHTVDILEHMS